MIGTGVLALVVLATSALAAVPQWGQCKPYLQSEVLILIFLLY
jgi:hypothetical protein